MRTSDLFKAIKQSRRDISIGVDPHVPPDADLDVIHIYQDYTYLDRHLKFRNEFHDSVRFLCPKCNYGQCIRHFFSDRIEDEDHNPIPVETVQICDSCEEASKK